MLAAEDSLGRRPPLATPPPPAEAQGPVSLGSAPVEARVEVSTEIRRLLASFPTEATAGRRLAVSLENIRVEGQASVFYELYVDLPPGVKDTVYTSPHYLGNLDFFGEPPLQRRFNLVPTFLRLRQLKAWSDETLRLTFVPRPFTEGEDPAKLLGTRTQAVVGRVSLRIE